MQNRRLILLSLLVLLIVASCRNKIRPLLINSPCTMPCWDNITPGSTSGKEAMLLLGENPIITNVEIGDISWSQNGYTIRADLDRNQGIEIYVEDEIVEAIWISSSGLSDLNITFSELIGICGEPHSVYIDSFYAGDAFGYMINFLYPEKSMLIRIIDGGKKGYVHLHGKDSISDIIFIQTDKFMEFMIKYVDGYEYFNLDKANPWEGYGKYELPH